MLRRSLGGDLRRDLLIFPLLVLVLATLTTFLAATPPTRLAFGVTEAPPAVIFRGFYGDERNASGTFRWARPGASISLPVAAPADYAISLTLQDSDAAPPGRQTTVYINGQEAGRATLTTTPQAYRFLYAFPPPLWASAANGTIDIELGTPAFIPPGDPRPLGPIVSAIQVEAAAGNTVNQPAFVAVALVALLALYGAARLAGLLPSLAGGVCALAILGFGGMVVRDRPRLLLLLLQQMLHPTSASFFAFAALAALAGCCIGVSRLPMGNWSATSQPAAVSAEHTATGTTQRAWIWAGVGAITALGFALRFARHDALSLWLDETATVEFARLPWPRVLGLQGVYDPHPPLYYVLVKLATAIFPEVTAGRLVSVIAGTATLPVVYALTRRLATWRAALTACLVLAVAPLHVWYSQEARMYTSALLFIALSYLALIAFAQSRRSGWAVLYGFSVLASLYLSYSSLYALIPQFILFWLITMRLRRASVPLWVAAIGAGCGYLPWIGRIVGTVDSLGQERAWYLGVTPEKVYYVALSAMGLKNRGTYFWGGEVTPWERSPLLLAALIAVLIATALVGGALLAHSSPLGPFTIGGLFLGTILVAAGISTISPGFADRTILAATLGWAIALGSAAFGHERPRWLDMLARGGVALALLASLITFDAFARGATKDDYRGLARDAALVTQLGTPIVAESWLGTALNAYQPGVSPVGPAIIGQGEAFWIAYISTEGGTGRDLQRDGAARGYERVFHTSYSDSLSLDFYLRPSSRPPDAAPLALPQPGIGAPGWQLPAGARLEGSGASVTVALTDDLPATFAAPHTPGSLYLLEAEIGNSGGAGQLMLGLQCLDATQTVLFTSSTVETIAPATGQTARVATFCPDGTATVRLVLQRQGGSVAFRDVRLWQAILPTTAEQGR